ncbi:MAG TPA: hypothetical protein PLN69_11315 [bacterium]|nr:hypothetical protein [bacterium]
MELEEILFQLLKVLSLNILFSGVVLLFSSSIGYRLLGITGCFIALLAVASYISHDGELLFILHIAITAYLIFGGIYMFRSGNRLYRAMAKICFLSLALMAVPMIAMTYRGHKASKTKYYFGGCYNLFSRFSFVQEEYHKANGKYAPDLKTISEYAGYLCRNDKEYFCDLFSDEEMSKECEGISLTVTDKDEYRIEARSGGGTGCYLCLTPRGINRWHHWECSEESKNQCL